MIFQAGNVHESASLFNLKKKDTIDSRIRTDYPDGLIFYANYWIIEELLGRGKLI